jgi:enoyl-CoA hydratase/carnithine racemase
VLQTASSELNVVEYELRDGIAWIFLNRPHRLNAVIPQLVSELVESLKRANDEEVKAVVLAGRGASFCAGFDLKQELPERSEWEHRRQIERIHDVTRLIRSSPFAVISSVHGYALGNGCEFALACDFIVAAENAEFGFPEVRWGLSVTGGITALLTQSAGIHVAKNLILLGDRFSAERAHQLGLVSVVTREDALESVTSAFAQEIAARPRDAFARAKRAIDLSVTAALEMASALETEQSIVAGRDRQAKSEIRSFSGGDPL